MHHFNNEFSPYAGGQSKDKVPQRHNTVIIKRLLVRNIKLREKVFNTELQMLTSVKHPNIVTLLGFCFEGSEMILVIEKFSNGFLDAALQQVDKKSILTWEKRLKICIDVAQALTYIHFEIEEQKTIINCDVRCAYIALDENWEAKIAEFGSSVFLPPDQDDEALHHDVANGSRFYKDPEYEHTGKLKRESDVYSFGVVMFEILFGKIANDPIYKKESGEGLTFVARRCFNMGTLEDMIDPTIKDLTSILHGGPYKDSLRMFIEIAYKCIAKTQERRPTMKIILKQLQKCLFLQEKGVQSLGMEQLVDKQGEALELQSHETCGKHLEHLKIPLIDIQLATENFSERYSISNNGYHAFYRAEMHHFNNEFSSSVGGKNKDKLPRRHKTVIIKRLLVSNSKLREEVFNTEIQMLTSVKHPKIVTLLGFCFEGSEMILVIENFSNGFLGAALQHVNKKSILTWEKRLKICIDVAQALNYIHSEREEQMIIINRDIRCDYIMLDENYVAKIAEFGLAVVLPPNQDDQALHHNVTGGTSWYKDPEYQKTGKLKRESDVYSFGVVLFEILFGRKAYDPIYLKESDDGLAFVARRYFNMGTLEDMVDPIIQDQIGEDNFILDRGSNKDSLRTFIDIAYKCIAKTQDERPTMKIIHKQLQKALLFQGKHLEHLRIPLNSIQLATAFFSERYIVRGDRFHVWYKADFHHLHKEFSSSVDGKNKDKVPQRNNTVLIKRTVDEGFREEEFYTEIKILTSVKHPNIVTLVGFCVEGSEINLVIENFSNGSLRDALLDVNIKRTLTWDKRLKICIDVAQALNYIHYEMEDQMIVISRSITSENIMLNESWKAKITDFEMSVFLPPNQEDEALYLKTISGHLSYIDPEYIETGKLKRESDVYSFGVVMFEILLGLLDNSPTDDDSDEGFVSIIKRCLDRVTLEDIIDPALKNKIDENNFLLNRGPNKDYLRAFYEIALKCVAETQDERPSMKAVLNQLEKALFLQENNKDNPFIPLEDIKRATQNFHADKLIGRGGFGKVYIGKLQNGDGKTIVAKRLDTSGGQVEQQFLGELQILLEYKHANIIGLVGFCDENGEKIIVYEFASRSSLDRYLDDARLTWKTRLNICIEVASALDFLHGGAGKQAKVVHRDIKTANILLNHNWNAKLADFGLSLISPLAQETDYIINRPCGTRGYVDPLYAKSKFLTIKSDVYSFGVVLFEILCGRSTFRIYEQEGLYLPDFIKKKFEEGKHDEVVFKQIREQVGPKSLTTFQEIAYQCLQHESESDPQHQKF